MNQDPDTSTKTKDEQLSDVLKEINERVSHVNRRCQRLEEAIEHLQNRYDQVNQRCADLEAELQATERRLDSRVDDERSDRERADDSIRSDLDSVRHDVTYGR